MNQHEWIKMGVEHRWCSPPICYMHDGIPLTPAEDDALHEGHDPCMHIIRLYEDTETADAVEEYFSPAVWRKAPYEEDPF